MKHSWSNNRILACPLSAWAQWEGVEFDAGDKASSILCLQRMHEMSHLSDPCMCVIIAPWKWVWWNKGMKQWIISGCNLLSDFNLTDGISSHLEKVSKLAAGPLTGRHLHPKWQSFRWINSVHVAYANEIKLSFSCKICACSLISSFSFPLANGVECILTENNASRAGQLTARLEWLLSQAIIACMKGQGCLLTPGESTNGAGGACLWSRDNFVLALRQLHVRVCAFVCVCWREGCNCCRHPSSLEPRCRLGELEESFHLGGNERLGALWGEEVEEAKLQSSMVWQSVVFTDLPFFSSFEWCQKKKVHIFCQ